MVYRDAAGRHFPSSLTQWFAPISSSDPVDGHLIFTSRMLDNITVNTDRLKNGSIVWQTSVPAESSYFKHPYSVVQKFTIGPCGASVAISCSCTDHDGVLKNKIKITGSSSLSQRPSNFAILYQHTWCLVKGMVHANQKMSTDRHWTDNLTFVTRQKAIVQRK